MHSLRFILLLHQYSYHTYMVWYRSSIYIHRLQIQFISFKVGSKDANGTVAVQLKNFFANPQYQFTIFDLVHYILPDILRNIKDKYLVFSRKLIKE